MKKEKDDVTTLKGNRKAILEQNSDNIDELGKGILGYGSTIEKLIDYDIPDVNFTNTSINKNQVIGSDLFSMTGRDKGTKYNINERFYGILSDNSNNVIELHHALQQRQALNSEMNYLINNMIEIQNALDMLANDVVYPNISDTSGIKIEFFNNDENKAEETYTQLIKFFKPLDDPLQILHNRRVYNYSIEEDVRGIVQHLGLYGHQIVASIPYKKIVQDLLYDKAVTTGELEKDKAGLVGSTGEAANIVDSVYRKLHKPYSESLKVETLSSVVTPGAIHEIRNIYNPLPYSEADVEYVKHLIKTASDDILTEYAPKTKPINGNIGKILAKSENGLNPMEYNSIEVIKAKKNKKFNIDKIVGCTHDILDPSKTVPVYIKDEIIGVYVVETNQTRSIELNGTISNLINASNLTDGTTQLNGNYSNKIKEILFRDIKTVLFNNLDKNLLKNNPNLIEDIEFIMRGNIEYGDYNPQVKFIPAEYLTIHKIGNGPLGTPLLLKCRTYAHMYIQLLKSDLTSKVFFEKPRYAVKLPFNGDTSMNARIMQSINSFRHAVPRLNDIGIPDIMNNSSANYHTVVIPMNNEDKAGFEIEQLPALETKDNTEYLAYLRNQVTMTIGYPADIFDPSQQMDFAKKIANINMNMLTKILALQKNLSVTLSELCTKRLKHMTGNENIEVKVTFEVPSELTSTVNKEMLDQKNALSDVYFAIIDADPRIPDKHREQVKQAVNRKLLDGLIDQQMLTDAIVDVTTYKEGTRQIED